jgi:isocitrate/isopropylmalate dehydrogenase
LYNKIITDYASSTSSSSLSLLPSSNEGQQSHLRQTQGSQTYIHRREEHTFIQSEIDNEDEGN